MKISTMKEKENQEQIVPELDFEEWQDLYGITLEIQAEMDEAILWGI